MQIPSTHHSGNEPFIFKNGSLAMPQATQLVPLDQQEPHAQQFKMTDPSDNIAFNDILKRVFNKKSIIWHIDYNWTKEGDCNVFLMYSDVIKKEKSEDAGLESTTVGTITPEVIKVTPREEKLFDEFVSFLEESKLHEQNENINVDIRIEDDDE